MERLYHYANVSSLALILKNKTLRFSSLPRLDDPVEAQMSDVQSVASFCFVSSWTSESAESIPM